MAHEAAKNGRSKVTISDIARASDVSPATVSLVLRHKPGVGRDTRERVLRSARSLGYPLPVSQASSDSLSSIGLIMKVRPNDPPLNNFFYAPVLAGIEASCRKRKINLFYAHLPVDADNNPLEPPRLLTEQHADGLLFVGAVLNAVTTQILAQQGVPVVLVDAYAETGRYDSVVTDNQRGGRRATEYLIAHGHRHIGIVGSKADAYPSILERRTAFLDVMAEHGLTPQFADCHHHPDEAVPAATAFLEAHPEVTAVFGVNDDVAISVIQAARALGRRVPEELSVIGFDNISLAQHMTPPLTTMRVDKMGMGRLAADLLINRITHPEAGHVCTMIRPSLIERASVQTAVTP